jgi:HPt (histidine-containing phosphotransfer) domain-containing protein
MDSVDEQTASSGMPLDYSSALQWADGDRSLLAELAEVFVEDCPQRMNELEEAVKGNNTNMIRNAAHSLKGMVSGFGARRANTLAQEMEDLGRAGNLPKAATLLPAVKHEFARVMEHLKTVDWQAVN